MSVGDISMGSRPMFSKIIEQAIVFGKAGDQRGCLRKIREAKNELEATPFELRQTKEALLSLVEKRYLSSSGEVFAQEDSDKIPEAVLAEESTASPEIHDGKLLSKLDSRTLSPGVTLVAGCMNREENLLKVIDSWLATDADEIVIVDWSSRHELWPKLSRFADPRIKVIRIDGEKHWVAAMALNVGFRFASHERIYRVDCDIRLADDFFRVNAIKQGEFIRGFWKAGLEHGGDGQQFIQGTFGAWKSDLRNTNYYDERITTYGWEDSDIYLRLSHDLGLAGRVIDPGTLTHIEQAEEQRLANQAVPKNKFLGKFEPTEFEGAKNKFYTYLSGNWGIYLPSQDYRLGEVVENHFRGRRISKSLTHNPEFWRIAEYFAAKQLADWASSSPEIGRLGEVDIPYARLLRDAHEVNKSRELVEGIKQGEGLYFIRCEPGPCRTAMQKTVRILQDHYPLFAKCIVLAEDLEGSSTQAPSNGKSGNLIVTTGSMIDRLSQSAKAEPIAGFGDLEKRLIDGDPAAYQISISPRSIAQEVISKSTRFSELLKGEFQPPSKILGNAHLVTSLYDEQNLIRLVEYLACVVGNLKVFDQVAVCYEASSGLLATVIHEICENLSIPPGRVLLLPFQKRPTFEDLFATGKYFPAQSIIIVSNADIVFDGTMSKIENVDLTNTIAVLSRKDISEDGTRASLLRLDNGSPNTFSADAWIFTTPFEADFHLDYPIGSFHCDSFINHQVSTSARYDVVNLCLDINAYHLHDERFNSSAEKHVRDYESIQEIYRKEQERNGGENPVNGVAWSSIFTSGVIPANVLLQTWRPKAVFYQIAKSSEMSFGHLVLLHWLLTDVLLEDPYVLVNISISEDDYHGLVGKILARYLAKFPFANVALVIEEQNVPENKYDEQALLRRVTFREMVEWMTSGNLENLKDFIAWPPYENKKLIRCEIGGEMSMESTIKLLSNHGVVERIMRDMHSFFNSLPNYSAEKNMLAPYVLPLSKPLLGVDKLGGGVSRKPTVTFVTSLFRGGDFLRGYLENVLTAAMEANGEVIIVDANPDDRDERVVRDFMLKNPAAGDYIEYIHLDHDPGIYGCWQFAINRARAELVTNANIDDRRSPHHTSRLVKLLNEQPEMGGACGTISCVRTKGETDWFSLIQNELWFYGEGMSEIGFKDLFRFNERGEVLSRDVMHCMPVWRKSLHDKHGLFDEAKYGTSADWAFWLKCSKAGERFAFDELAFGRYYLNPDSHNRRNDPEGIKERRIIKDFIGVDQSVAWKQ